MTTEEIITQCARGLAMDSAHIPAIKSVLAPYFQQAIDEEKKELVEALIELRDWYQEFTGLPAAKANAALAKARAAIGDK